MQTNNVLVSILIATGGTMNTDTVKCLLELISQSSIPKFAGFMTGGYKNNSLTLSINQALRHNVSHLLFIDNDMVFPPDALTKLIQYDKDIIGADYNQRSFPLTSTAKIADENGKLIAKKLTDEEKRSLLKVYSLGLGFVLIKAEVFKKIPKPWFNSPLDEEDNFMTEDFYFFDKANKAGIEVWCDPSLAIRHQGFYLY